MPNIFNRKDPQVVTDAAKLTREDFIAKYNDTTATEKTLGSVFDFYNKGKQTENRKMQITEEAQDFPQPEQEEETDLLIEEKPKKKTKATTTKVTSETKPATTKPGRTPRMRELLKDPENMRDKATIKRLLEEEGYDCSGSGFHSEWNRIKNS